MFLVKLLNKSNNETPCRKQRGIKNKKTFPQQVAGNLTQRD
jgi:hypothetical protein